MFTARLTETWGASTEIQALFLIEQRLDLVASTEPVYQVRERGTGIRSWIKCSDGTEESVERLRSEAFILPPVSHPHIMSFQADRSTDNPPFLVYPWQAEVPLADLQIHSISGPDRARMALALVEAAEQLQANAVSHGRILLENLWISPSVQWLRLAGFNHASLEASRQLLEEDRAGVHRVLTTLLPAEELSRIDDEPVLEIAEAWQVGEPQTAAKLLGALRRIFLTYVTEDL